MDTLEVLHTLVRRLDASNLPELKVIPWAAPVVSFGKLSSAKIATLGLNPSNREFVDVDGNELDGYNRRFHSLKSLKINSWSDARCSHLEAILDSCDNYFSGNPYDNWFQALNRLIVGINASYYGMFSEACHLDLVPYATACKWFELNTSQRTALLRNSSDALGMLLRKSSVEMLILNGRSVIEHLQSIADCKFKRDIVPDWTLPRRSNVGVSGYAYTGKIYQVAGVGLSREISVLGYSHNIQSSYGVTSKVKESIRQWIAHSASEVFC